jgi:CRP/FNR family transcriptional regulator, cyclic AMP receptor protein
VRFKRVDRDVKLQLLRSVPLFSACSNRDLGRIATLAEEIDVPEGKALTQQGEPGREFFVIVDGSARAAIRGKGTAALGPGAFFGEMSLLDQGPRSATVTATTDMRLLVLDSRSFSSLVEETPGVARKIMRTLAERLREAERHQPAH